MIIELDTVAEGFYGETAHDAGRTITNGYDVTFTVVTENGPGGGHPVIRYEGDEAELRRMVAEHYGPDTIYDYFTAEEDAVRKIETTVRHIIETSDVTTKAGLRGAVRAIAEAWLADVERVKREGEVAVARTKSTWVH